ncbi:cellulase family glycosylhydrolase [Bacteroides graminisolvens]|uniref:cellulase family glycosylhydrolase n=1 Tax=Bacteroides graminisolvens TaxID=477666 RepID=UPI0023F4EBB9|nr:cellulase family glycosylhydrolase [Bacteroides graminisolvens]MDD3211497.1 cellulase family glycosylhydrolase [Bacteroides graminisolvens]
MKRNLKFFVMLLLVGMLSSCSDDKTPITEEPPKENPTTPEEETTDEESALPVLTVVGRYLKNNKGEIVNLHGFAQTYSPYFNQNAWNNYDVSGCLSYNKRLIDQMQSAGWKFNFIRMHLDPYWSDDTSKESVRYEGHERFSSARFQKYLDELFIPMAKYAISKGLYIVMRPPGVAPEKIAVGDDYQKFLLTVWNIVSKHPDIKNNMDIMFELANEPIHILGPDGTYAGTGSGHFMNLKSYFQTITDKVRANGAKNIIWVPGLSYQSSYSGYATYPIEGENIGYAVHVYPGWYGSDAQSPSAELGGVMGGGYDGFQRGWDAQVMPVANFAPIMITEMDWAPEKYNSSWGKSITGEVGGTGFGANFKYIMDRTGNASWLLFTSPHLLAQFKNVAGTEGNYAFLNDPEACPWPVYHWFKEYAGEAPAEGDLNSLQVAGVTNSLSIRMGDSKSFIVKAVYVDGTTRVVTSKSSVSSSNSAVLQVDNAGKMVAVKEGQAQVTISYTSAKGVTKQLVLTVNVITPFPLTAAMFNPSIWEKGTFDEGTRTLVTGKYGFGGWEYANGLNLSAFKTLTIELGNDNQSSVSFRLFDKTSYWTDPATYDFGSSRKVVVDLQNMKDKNGLRIDPSHLYIIGFWSTGDKPIVIDKVLLDY